MSTETKETYKQKARKLLKGMNESQMKLVNKWTGRVHKMSIAAMLGEIKKDEKPPVKVQQLLVEVAKALDTDNWTFFDPESNNPSKGQAVTSTPQKGDEPTEPEPEEIEDEEEEAEEVIPKQDGKGVPASRIPQDDDIEDEEEDDDTPSDLQSHGTPAPLASTDPLAGLVDAVAERLIAKGIGGINMTVLDKHLQNGGFPVKRVDEMLDERQVQTIVNFLKSQPSELVDRAIEIYES
jgi:hypothetical protein